MRSGCARRQCQYPSGFVRRIPPLRGKSLIAFTSVQLREHSQAVLRSFEQKSVKFREVMECYRLTGQFDFLLKIAIRDMQEYNGFLMDKLATLANIGSVQTYFVLSEGKSETAYPLNF